MLLELYEDARWEWGSVHYCRRALKIEEKRNDELSHTNKSDPEQVKVLIDNILLAIKMNASMLSVQQIPRSRGKVCEFVNSTNESVRDDVQC